MIFCLSFLDYLYDQHTTNRQTADQHNHLIAKNFFHIHPLMPKKKVVVFFVFMFKVVSSYIITRNDDDDILLFLDIRITWTLFERSRLSSVAFFFFPRLLCFFAFHFFLFFTSLWLWNGKYAHRTHRVTIHKVEKAKKKKISLKLPWLIVHECIFQRVRYIIALFHNWLCFALTLRL